MPRSVINGFYNAENAELTGSGLAAWKRIVSSLGKNAALCFAAGRCVLGDNAAYRGVKAALRSGDCLTLSSLAFNGPDAAALGYNGKEIGTVLEFLLDYVIQHPDKNEKETLKMLARDRLRR